jgi:hypothetical protein
VIVVFECQVLVTTIHDRCVSEFPSWRDMEIIQLIMKVWEEMGMESQLEYNRREIMMSTHTLANCFRRRRGSYATAQPPSATKLGVTIVII